MFAPVWEILGVLGIELDAAEQAVNGEFVPKSTNTALGVRNQIPTGFDALQCGGGSP